MAKPTVMMDKFVDGMYSAVPPVGREHWKAGAISVNVAGASLNTGTLDFSICKACGGKGTYWDGTFHNKPGKSRLVTCHSCNN